jgi:glycosyltransferase involved in cell wall biosynthesis
MNPSIFPGEIGDSGKSRKAESLTKSFGVLFVGRLDESKGIWRALEIAFRLKRMGLHFQLHVLGDGPLRAKLEAWVREKDLEDVVAFHGWLSRAELNGFYTEAHFLLLPSASEGWPKVASEAMAYGAVPVLGAVSSIPQVIASTKAGIALPPDDLDGFAEAIGRLANDTEVWQQLVEHGSRAAEMFTYDEYVRKISRMFAEVWGVHV